MQYCTYLYISGIRLVAKGYKLVADGWALFKKMAEETASGELQQLLCSLTSTTPTKLKEEKEEPMEEEPGPSNIVETLLFVNLGCNMYEYRHGNCDVPQ